LVVPLCGLAWAAFNQKVQLMSKRTRYADNSKRQQPVQQQRAQAAQRARNQKKEAKVSPQEEPQERSAEQGTR
jgi:hypothetical protein